MVGICLMFFFHSSNDGHLDCFCFLTIVTNTAMKIHVQFWSRLMFSVLLVIHPEVELLGHMVTSCFTFCGIAKLFPKRAAPFHNPTCNV